MNVILASNSPRRKELLTRANIEFKVIPSKVKEQCSETDVYKYAEILASQKATDVFNLHGGIVLGADTVVCYNGKIFGKPKNQEEAINTLRFLSSKTHEVITGFAIISTNFKYISHEVTKVTFNDLSENLILEYVKTGSPLDKAGSYGIQDGFDLVKKIDGSYTNVIGLPVERILEILRGIQ